MTFKLFDSCSDVIGYRNFISEVITADFTEYYTTPTCAFHIYNFSNLNASPQPLHEHPGSWASTGKACTTYMLCRTLMFTMCTCLSPQSSHY